MQGYKKTIAACYMGYIVQAVVNNLLPLLFVYFNTAYKIPLGLISFIVTYNFALQILFDYLSSKIILKLGYRKTAILSDAFCAAGLIVAATSSLIFSHYIAIYVGIMLSVTLMAIGGGVTEVIVSPMVEALPVDNKSSNMSFLHSGYCVGHLAVVLIATGYFYLFGVQNWQYLAYALTLIPIINVFLYMKCPIVSPEGDDNPVKVTHLFKDKLFILVFLMMIAAGAAEQSVAQWISYYAEKGLGVNKTLGDLIGVCAFALTMFLSRILGAYINKKVPISKVLFVDSVLLTVCFLLSVFSPSPILSLVALSLSGFFVGLTWPGTYSLSGEVFPLGGTTMFSILALGGDIGCTLGPTVVGFVADGAGGLKAGFSVATIFPLVMLVGITVTLITLKKRNSKTAETLPIRDDKNE